ncbi:hypothetical protein DYB25_013383 [Aphanomyces astaci]|uniref:Thioredoxin-like fold domain-containing protein n=1 Tax=Aphanomyces astaci TaxID=112090 RepID=A0A397BZK5_APHAT|nr:hypothetical protein DYB25_013383 [Aphanomyces astaci]RHY44389.1 hypothetical protein DYB30_006104 [Aphanomyces astaci]RHZ18951.1 hypothetical protein DYB26_011990 [Aphanomyces astaci]
MVSLLAVIAFVAAATTADAPIPKRPLGLTYNYGSPHASIQLDFFLDLLCPYSRDAFPHVTKIADDYPDKIRVLFHHFPLPYHRNAFVLHHAGQAFVNITGSDEAFTRWAAAVFKNQTVFNQDVGLPETKAAIKKLALTALPELGGGDVDSGLKSRDRNLEVRADFKYGTTRGVYGTPSIYLNGIHAFDDVDYDILYAKIRPLLG